MRRLRGIRPTYLLALLVGLSLASCAEEGPGPQFANDPAPTRAATEAPVVASPAPLPTSRAAATPASVSDLLAARGAPTNVFTVADGTVWSVSSTGDATRLFEAPEGFLIQDIDPAPGGQRVAVLLQSSSEDQQTADVVILDSVGETTVRVGELTAGTATPVARGEAPGAETIDWSPQGDRALVAFQNGAIVELPVDGTPEPSQIAVNVEIGSVVNPAWSPTGESIAFISERDDERTRALHVLDVRDGSVSAVVDPPNDRFVVDFAWMPNGNSLLFTEGGDLGGAVSGIDLWRVDADGENRELVVSAGTVAPVARISNIRPSPDGRSVAYSVLVPGAGSPRVDSVWVRDLGSRLGFKVPLPSVAAVDAIWWTDRGLVISVTTRGTAGRPATEALLQVNRDGSVEALWAAPIAAGTPESDAPVASPVAP